LFTRFRFEVTDLSHFCEIFLLLASFFTRTTVILQIDQINAPLSPVISQPRFMPLETMTNLLLLLLSSFFSFFHLDIFRTLIPSPEFQFPPFINLPRLCYIRLAFLLVFHQRTCAPYKSPLKAISQPPHRALYISVFYDYAPLGGLAYSFSPEEVLHSPLRFLFSA